MRNPNNTDKAIRLLEVQVRLFNDFDGASTTKTPWEMNDSEFPRPRLTQNCNNYYGF